MKNIHILPTDKPSRLVLDDTTQQLILINKGEALWGNRNIYIINDEEIKEGDWFYLYDADIIAKYVNVKPVKEGKKIILTTDQDLIKDGVQAIDDEFLEWFVKNPSCEEVEVKLENYYASGALQPNLWQHKIIPKEEPKQETLEEAAENTTKKYINEREKQTAYLEFIEGAKWQSERMYSEQEAYAIWKAGKEYWRTSGASITFEELLEQFKKK